MRIHKLFVLSSFAVLVLMAGSLAAVHWFQSGRIAQALLTQADLARDKADAAEESKFLSRYLEFVPTDSAILTRYAALLRAHVRTSRDLVNLQFVYERILRLDPNNTEARRAAVAVAMDLQRHSDALAHLEHLPQDGQTLEWAGLALHGLGQHMEAVEKLRASIADQPNRVRTYDMLAYVLRKSLNRIEDSKLVVADLIAKNPYSAEAFLIQARYQRQDNDPKASESYSTALVFDPENADALMGLAEMAQAKGQVDVARSTYADCCQTYPRDVRGYRAIAWLELWLGQREAGKRWLQEGVAQLPNETELLVPYADLLIEEGDLATAEKLQAKVRGPAQAYLTVRASMQRKDWPDALNRLQQLRADAIGRPALLTQVQALLADCYLAMGDKESAIDALSQALASQSSSLLIRMKMARTYVKLGRTEEAIREYKSLAAMPGAPAEARLALAKLMLGQSLGQGLSPQQKQEITELARAAQGHSRESAEATLLEAELLAMENRFGDATTLLRAALEKDPHEARLWLGLIALSERSNGTRAALRLVDEAVQACGETIELRLQRAALVLPDPDCNRPAVLARLTTGLETLAVEDRTRLLFGLAELSARLRDSDSAKSLIAQLLAIQPNHVDAWKMRFDLALRDGDTATITQTLAQVEKLGTADRKHFALLEARAKVENLTRDKSGLPAVQALVTANLGKFPDHFLAHQSAGRLADIMGDAATALMAFRKAVERNPADVVSLSAACRLHLQAKQVKQAEQLFTRSASKGMPAENLKSVLESTAKLWGDDVLFRLARTIAPEGSQSVRDRLWLAGVLQLRGQAAESLMLYQQTAEDNPDSAEARVALVRALARGGDRRAAEQALDAGRAVMEAANPALVAECYEALQQYDRAVQERTKLLSTAPDFTAMRKAVETLLTAGRSAEARQMLERQSQTMPAGSAERAWAKRTLALILSGEPGRVGAMTGLRLIQENLSANDTPEDRRAKGIILLTGKTAVTVEERAAALREAVSLLEPLAHRPGASSRDRFDLARAYVACRDYERAKGLLETLTTEEPGNTLFLAYQLNVCLANGELTLAKPVAERAARVSPPDYATSSVVARYLLLTGELDGAVATLDRYADVVRTGGVPNKAARLDELANLYEEFGRSTVGRWSEGQNPFVERALSILKANPKTPPARLASLMGLNLQFAQGLDHLATARLDPIALALAGLAVLTPQAPAKQFERVRDWIEAARKASPTSPTVALAVAEFAQMRGDSVVAEKAYRSALASDTTNLVALNNLAWLLAVKGERLDEAAMLIERAIRQAGPIGELLDTRSRVNLARNNMAAAQSDIELSLAEMQTASRYFRLAVIQKQLGQSEAAKTTFQRAVQMGLSERVVHPLELPEFRRMQQ